MEPVRKIPKNYLVTTGRVSRGKGSKAPAGFEGQLENDYLIGLRHDPAVHAFVEQPVKIPWSGSRRPYVPDVLVHFRPNTTGLTPPPQLTEVKTRGHYEKYREKFAARFHAADAYARDRGWVFVKLDETDIRTTWLENIRFLRAYVECPPATDCSRITSGLIRLGGRSSATELIASLSTDQDEQLRLYPTLWHLVLNDRVMIDKHAPMGGDVSVWIGS